MEQDRGKSRSDHIESRAVAHNVHSAGIALPAVTPVQLLKEDQWSVQQNPAQTMPAQFVMQKAGMPPLLTKPFQLHKDALSPAGSSQPVFQFVWKKKEDGNIEEWDEVIDGFKWFYNTENKKYFFTLENPKDKSAGIQALQNQEKSDTIWDRNAHVSLPKEINKDFEEEEEYKVEDEENEKEENGKEEEEKKEEKEIKKPEPPAIEPERSEITDPLILACIKSFNTDEKQNGLSIQVVRSLSTGAAPDSGIMKEFSVKISKRMRDYLKNWKWFEDDKFGVKESYVTISGGRYYAVNVNEEEIRTAYNRSIWNNLNDSLEDEEGYEKGFSSDEKYRIGLQKAVIGVDGFILHFTNRVKEEDILSMRDGCRILIQTIKNIQPAAWSKILIENLEPYFKQTLHTLVSATGAKANTSMINSIAKENAKSVKAERIEAFATAVVVRWHAALNNMIHIVFDRAQLNDVFGKTKDNAKATPEAFWSNNRESLEVGQRITINLDAGTAREAIVTLAHELGHAIGFNPGEVDPHGHFTDITRYIEQEHGDVPKLLLDAYFFETIIDKILS
ncbi:hypothetical protein CLV51_103316 [Chitinophaga niastensis]|uniref:Uncharacterized protein n=1 Tax=Chitinophaga niastensis TaxID=536980 RepID=A0A2P8HJD8_CHINA|nr:hypothetical protein [Chitinophaga niastensis]PSL46338.1 hypothetical protein CLV51_103316 [Chitinophaga niastensis]